MVKCILFYSTVILLCSCDNSTQQDIEDNKIELVAVVDVQHGFYKGTLPCHDCNEILTLIELKDDQTATIFETFVGKETLPYATFGTWSSINELVTFTDENGNERLYKATTEGLVAEDLVNSKNKKILSKHKLTIDFTKPFIAEGRYFYMADAHIFTFMGDKRVFPVLTNQENLKVEQQFLKLSDDEQKCFCIQIKGQLIEAADMEGRVREHLKIVEFLEVVSKTCPKQVD